MDEKDELDERLRVLYEGWSDAKLVEAVIAQEKFQRPEAVEFMARELLRRGLTSEEMATIAKQFPRPAEAPDLPTSDPRHAFKSPRASHPRDGSKIDDGSLDGSKIDEGRLIGGCCLVGVSIWEFSTRYLTNTYLLPTAQTNLMRSIAPLFPVVIGLWGLKLVYDALQPWLVEKLK